MILSAAAILTLAAQCSANIAPQTLAAIVQTESHGNPLALNVNKSRQPMPQVSAANAAATAKRYVAAGYSVDLGLGQINSRNMKILGLTWETVFDPCTTVAALGRVLTKNFEAVRDGKHPQTALRIAISMYNTGSQSRGFHNGYVNKVVASARIRGDALSRATELAQSAADTPADRRSIVDENSSVGEPVAAQVAPPPAWNLFERAAYARNADFQNVDEGSILWKN
jgi:type IV secretion system protein VirB1